MTEHDRVAAAQQTPALVRPVGPWYSQVNPEQWRAFWATFLGWVLDGFDFTIVTFILIDIERTFTVDRALAGALGTVTLLMRFVGGAVAGTAAEGVRGSVVFIVVSAAMVAVALAFILALVAVGRRFARMLPPRLREQYIRFHEGALGSFRRLPAVGFYSFAIWLCEALRLFLVVHALGLSVSPSLVLLVSLVNAVLTTIPLTPGGIGFVEPGVVGALTLALSRDDAVAVALLDRSISYGSVLVFGALALAFYELVVVRRRAKIEGARASPSAP